MIDPLKKLILEYPACEALITSYTSRGTIPSYLEGLKQGITDSDKESILYFLERICDWYNNNIGEILSNSYVYDTVKKQHLDCKDFFDTIRNELADYAYPETIQKSEDRGTKRVFLSHKSDDKKYGDALEKFLVGLGLAENQLIYTSHPLHKIPLGKNIYDYLRSNINNQVFMIILFSNKYLDSPACVSEMGAAWVMQTDYVMMYTPDFSFENPKYNEIPLDNSKMGAVLKQSDNCKASMIELKNQIAEFFGLTVSENKVSFLIDEFMKNIS